MILVKTGISGVSAESAANNLKVELPGWDFEKVRRSAREKWNQQLSRIKIKTENETHQRIFYAALYHACVGPSLFDDVDGRYRGMDKQIHQLRDGQRNYTAFSLWDTYRAAHPLYTLMSADRVPDFANALIRMAIDAARPGGRVMLFAQTQHGETTINPAAVCVDEKTLMGSYSASVDIQDEALGRVFDGYAHGYDLTRLVSHRFPLSELNRAFHDSEWAGGGTEVVRGVLVP